jgi:hypothetical protein
MKRGLLVAGVHLAIVLGIFGKYSWDRANLPRAWARTMNYDPNLPIRGRYVSLLVVLDVPDPAPQSHFGSARVVLGENGDKLAASLVQTGGLGAFKRGKDAPWALAEPVPFFIPEHAADPTRLKPGEELWVELSVPPRGEPRAVRLGVKRGGSIDPLPMQ